MSYQTERRAIEAYLKANWTLTPIGMDGQEFTPTANSIRINIASGATLQGSIGRDANVLHHIGTLTITIYTQGGKGSDAWRAYAETLMGLLFEVSLTNTGAVATTTGGVFVRFSPPQLGDNQPPYIGANFQAPPFHIVNLIAPFVRYETR